MRRAVSVLFNEPKLLKWFGALQRDARISGFSALQRAEIAEIWSKSPLARCGRCFSALQRAEIAEIGFLVCRRFR